MNVEKYTEDQKKIVDFLDISGIKDKLRSINKNM